MRLSRTDVEELSGLIMNDDEFMSGVCASARKDLIARERLENIIDQYNVHEVEGRKVIRDE